MRAPFADSTLFPAPESVPDELLVLMADIFPTGWFAANNGFKLMTPEEIAEATVVVIGCGPVGLCAVVNCADYKPKHLFAVDSVESRLALAKELGAEPLNFQTDREGLDKRIKEVTEGRGADLVVEVVGLSPALKMGFEILRPWGIISSVGVHNGEIPWSGNQAYGKNLRIQVWLTYLEHQLSGSNQDVDGTLSSQEHFSPGARKAQGEAPPARVILHVLIVERC